MRRVMPDPAAPEGTPIGEPAAKTAGQGTDTVGASGRRPHATYPTLVGVSLPGDFSRRLPPLQLTCVRGAASRGADRRGRHGGSPRADACKRVPWRSQDTANRRFVGDELCGCVNGEEE